MAAFYYLFNFSRSGVIVASHLRQTLSFSNQLGLQFEHTYLTVHLSLAGLGE